MHKRTKLSIAAIVAMGGLTGLAHAQTDSPNQLERVEVTGSRIRQVDAETAQPVQKITAAEIQKSGLVTVGDILNQLTAAGSPDFSKGSALVSNSEEGGQYINLRNLGSNRLLVLVDGKRWTQSVNGYTDLSTIPSALIDHIDVLKDGASSIYGSDAIAGVVNIILKKTLDGGIASVYYGAYGKGDAQTQDMSFAFGANSDRSSVMFGATYNKVEPVWAKTRDITSQSYGTGDDGQFGAGFGAGPWGRIRQVNGSGAASGFNQYLNHTGAYNGDGTGQASNNSANYHTYTGAQADTYNSSHDMMFNIASELKTIFTKGSVEITPAIRFNAAAMYADRKSNAQVAGYPLNSLSQTGYPVYVDKNSYYNPYGNQGVGIAAGAGQDLFFYRRTIEVPRLTVNDNKASHLDAGFEGDLTIGGKAWNWDAGVNYSKSGGNETLTGNLNLPNLKKALGPSFMNSAGVVQCGTAAAPIGLSTCVPFNILGGPSASTPAALNYVMSTSQLAYGSTIKSFYADLSGEVYRLPAGPLSVALGAEKRDTSGYNIPDQIDQDALTTNLAGNSTFGKFSVKEAYVEVQVPLLKGVPGVELLNLDLASRYSDYSNFGNTTNSKASFFYKPIKDLVTRGTYSQAFRAPTLGDTFGGGSQTFDAYLDPCDTLLGAAKSDAGVQARCAAAGVPAGFRQVNQAGTPVTGPTQGITAFNAGAGNAFLQPETATTKTVGFVYSPSYLAGFNVGVDWYRVDIKNVITAVSATYVLNQCYVQNVNSFCSSLKRDPVTGMITSLSRGNANLGELLAEGYDIDVNYKFKPTTFGQFSLRNTTSIVTKNSSRSDVTAPFDNSVATTGSYRLRSNLTLDWNYQAWSATWTSRYFGAIKADCWDTDDTSTCSNPTSGWVNGTGYNRLGAVVYSDLSVGYKLPWKGQILVGAQNVLNKKPRINYDTNSGFGGNSSSSSVDPDMSLERFLWVRYTQSF